MRLSSTWALDGAPTRVRSDVSTTVRLCRECVLSVGRQIERGAAWVDWPGIGHRQLPDGFGDRGGPPLGGRVGCREREVGPDRPKRSHGKAVNRFGEPPASGADALPDSLAISETERMSDIERMGGASDPVGSSENVPQASRAPGAQARPNRG